jgi:hypothetical protein
MEIINIIKNNQQLLEIALLLLLMLMMIALITLFIMIRINKKAKALNEFINALVLDSDLNQKEHATANATLESIPLMTEVTVTKGNQKVKNLKDIKL